MSAFARQVPLSSGTSIPQVGLGVFQVGPDEAQAVVEQALEVGYRHIDTAAAYVNESGVGAAIRASGLDREEVFVTSKLRNGDQGHDSTLRAYADTCSRLGLDRLDLYLIHWPNPAAGLWQDSWRAMARLADQGEVAAAGVSNFLIEHLDELAAVSERLPAVNQIEVHPTYAQRELRDYCQARQIAVEAYSPLGQGADLQHETITAIAERLGVTPAQVILRWHLESGHIVIPKTVSPERMRSNADLDEVALTAEDLAAIDALEAGHRTGNDPRTFDKSQIR
ncbi:aldo/keto reductase [Ruania halotolerans]|uniref:aldo/keto reductase n=1 Tax=Ruania halotolerans TaxID=2897773 RepID=UPI001E5D11B1|nr:aldo/keto reductase [Ruania halotolerans]UFU06570.1 aldo/keto reductase [Ruania halotolerans]